MLHLEPFPFDLPSLVHVAMPVPPMMFNPAITVGAQPQLKLGGCGVTGGSVGPFPPENGSLYSNTVQFRKV